MRQVADAEATMDVCLRELDRLRSAFSRAQEAPNESGPRMSSVGPIADLLLSERDRLLSALGELALAWQLAGGTIELSLEPRPAHEVAREIREPMPRGDLSESSPVSVPSSSGPDSSSRSSRDERAAAKAALSTTVERYRTVLRAMMSEFKRPAPLASQIDMIDETDTLVEATRREDRAVALVVERHSARVVDDVGRASSSGV
ncbi:MAG: hypothetical protein U0165_04490 [Polyangiaceae bacterium]